VLYLGGAPIIASRREEQKALEPHQKYDENGSRKEYDAHYSRDIEQESGMRVTVQCDDTNCAKCYWKPRMLNSADNKDFPPGSWLLKKRQDWIKDQLDGLSDELYDSMYEDFLKEVQPSIDNARKALEAQRERKRQIEMEMHYATPYKDIVKYKEEGRTYSPHAGWSTKPDIKAKYIYETELLTDDDFDY
jgi:hypothetical protein